MREIMTTKLRVSGFLLCVALAQPSLSMSRCPAAQHSTHRLLPVRRPSTFQTSFTGAVGHARLPEMRAKMSASSGVSGSPSSALALILWTFHDGPANQHSGDEAFAVAVSPDGSKVFVTGSSYGGFKTHDDYATVAYEASTGSKLWVSRYDGPNYLSDGAASVRGQPEG